MTPEPLTELVVCSLEPWDEVWRRNQYFVTELLAQHPSLRVLFVEPPEDIWRPRAKGSGRGARPAPVDEYERLWRVRPTKPCPRILGPWADMSIRAQVRGAARTLGFSRPRLWVNDLNLVGLIRATGWPALYDVTDDWLVESTVPERVRRRRLRLESAALAECVEVVVCSPGLQISKGSGRRVTLVPNGVDVELMGRPQPRPVDLGPRSTAIYVGTLHEERIDIPLLCEVAAADSELNVVCVGPVALSPTAASALLEAGVTLLGPRAHDKIPGYLQHADVMVIPHLVNAFTESLDPIKAYECLAAGIPTVATKVAGFRELSTPVTTVEREAFTQAVLRVLRTSGPSPRHSHLPAGASWAERAATFGRVVEACV